MQHSKVDKIQEKRIKVIVANSNEVWIWDNAGSDQRSSALFCSLGCCCMTKYPLYVTSAESRT